jgi:methoxymalonate biosynthesis acyl carrier protein
MHTISFNTDFKEELKAFLEDASGINDIDDDTELFSSGIVNSLFAIQLMMFMEKKWNIEIGPDDLDMENFNSINSICKFLETKKLAAA